MVGVFQLALGLFKQGFLINFLSRPVISGYTSAAALIIGLNQLKHLLKIDLPQTNQMYILLGAAGQQLANTHILTLLVGLSGIVLILVLRKVNKSIPGPLITITLGILTIYYFQLDKSGVSIIQNVPPGLPSFQLPHVSWQMIQAMIPFALTIALVGFMESNAIANRIAARHKSYRLDTNQELIALGASNVFSSLIQGFPISGGFSRTAVNDQAGAKTPMASVFSALLVILTLAFFTPLFYYLPKALLASLIIVAVIGLIDVNEAKRLWKVDQKDFAMLVVTFAATLLTGVQYGIAIGVGLSLAIVLFKSAYPHVAIEGKLPTTELFRNIKRFPEAVEIPKVLIMRFDAQLFFGNMRFFKETIECELDKRPETRLVIINGQSINSIDSSGIYMLKELVEELQKESIDVAFVELKGPIRDIMVKNKLVSSLGSHHFFNETKDAINQFDGSVLRSSSDNSFQSNIEA
jgi:SulP family sulfate permease